jgi:hypothetical protein
MRKLPGRGADPSLFESRPAPNAGDGSGARRAAEPRQPQAVLDRAQQPVMRDRRPEMRARPNERSERERRDPGVSRVRFVEDDEHGGRRELQQPRQEAPQPGIAGRHRAVVHVVAEIRDDERKGGQPPRGEVARELGERDDAAQPRGARQHSPKVDEGVVLLRVAAARGAGPPRPREPLRVRLPRTAARRERVGEAPTWNRAARAVAGDPVCRAGDEREVVRQARVRDPAIAAEHGPAARERVERRRVRVAEHLAPRLVLEHHHDCVAERRHGTRGRLGAGAEHRHCREHERALHDVSNLLTAAACHRPSGSRPRTPHRGGSGGDGSPRGRSRTAHTARSPARCAERHAARASRRRSRVPT